MYTNSLHAWPFGVRPRWDKTFSSAHSSRPVLGPTQPGVQMYWDSFRVGKAARAWRWPPTPYSAEVKKEQRYTSILLCACLESHGVTFTFTFLQKRQSKSLCAFGRGGGGRMWCTLNQGCGVGWNFYVESESEGIFRCSRRRSRKEFLGGAGVGKNVPTPNPTSV
jgi:hypothetical protein